VTPSEWGPRRLADFTGVESCEGGTGHAPGGRTRNHCAPFLAIFHLYTPENPSTPRLSLFLLTPPPLHSTRRPGYAQNRRGGREPTVHHRTAHLSISFYYCTKVQPPLILVPPMLSNRRCGRGKVAPHSLQQTIMYAFLGERI